MDLARGSLRPSRRSAGARPRRYARSQPAPPGRRGAAWSRGGQARRSLRRRASTSSGRAPALWRQPWATRTLLVTTRASQRAACRA